MPPDGGDDRPGPDPLVGRGLGVVVVDRAARRIPAVEGVLRRPEGALRHRLVELPVIQAGKGPLLVNHAREGVGEGGVPHPVEHDGAHRHLSGIGLASGLRGNQPGQEVVVARAVPAGTAAPAGSARGGEDSHGLERRRPGYAVGDEPVLFLEPDHCVPGFGAVNPIHPVVQIAPVFQLGLDLPDFLALGADFGQGGIGAVPGARQHGDDQDV